MTIRTSIFVPIALLLCGPSPLTAAVVAQRLPDDGVQPQAVVDAAGTAHLVYLTGPPQRSDVVYRKLPADATALGPAMRVNTHPGSAIALGTVRGPRLALGRAGRVHVAWNGSASAPKGLGGTAPMLYTRFDPDRAAFEPERDLIRVVGGIDGGGGIAADVAGHVWVAWHGTGARSDDAHRRIAVAMSSDDGGTFAVEHDAAADRSAGACGCCSLAIVADAGTRLWLLYRAAGAGSDRDMTLLRSADGGTTVTGGILDRWQTATCPLSTCAFAAASEHLVAAWQTRDQIFCCVFTGDRSGPTVPMPGDAKTRKHPAMAWNARRQFLVAWTEGTGWNRGGTLAWQVFDASGAPTGPIGRQPGVPAWGTPAVIARGDDFIVFY